MKNYYEKCLRIKNFKIIWGFVTPISWKEKQKSFIKEALIKVDNQIDIMNDLLFINEYNAYGMIIFKNPLLKHNDNIIILDIKNESLDLSAHKYNLEYGLKSLYVGESKDFSIIEKCKKSFFTYIKDCIGEIAFNELIQKKRFKNRVVKQLKN